MEPFSSCISPVMPQANRSRARAGDQSRAAGSDDADVSRQILMDERTADSMFIYSNQNLGGQPDPGGELPVYVNSEEQLEVNSASICTFDYGSSLDDQSLLRHVNLQKALGLEGPSRRPSLKSWSSCDKDLQLPRGKPDFGTDYHQGNDDEVLIDEDELQYHDRAEPYRLLPTKNYHAIERRSSPPAQYLINNETLKSESTSKFEYSLDSEEQSSNPKLLYNGPLASMGSHSTTSFLGPTVQRDRSTAPRMDEESHYDHQHVRNTVMRPRRRRHRNRFSRMDIIALMGSGFLFLAATIGIVAALLLGDANNSKNVATTGFVGQRLPESEETSSPSRSPVASPPKDTPTPGQSLSDAVESSEPSFNPSMVPTIKESSVPSVSPSERPSELPTVTKSDSPSVEPSRMASNIPSFSPSDQPSRMESDNPTATISMAPSETPSRAPTSFPSTLYPSHQPSEDISQVPSSFPSTLAPSSQPSKVLSQTPTAAYSDFPSSSMIPSSSSSPSTFPTSLPSSSGEPSFLPSENPLSQLMDLIVDRAPPRTATALQDPSSAQSQALQWVAGDESSQALSNERKIQRFALATVSFEVLQAQGSRIRKERRLAANTWLDEDDDECRWTGIFCDPLKRVTVINLAQRGLPGRLPPELALLKDSLQLLDFTNNQFSGEIPSEYGQLSLLRFFRVSRNNLSGNIPDSFASMRILQHLNVHRNQLSGPFPNHPLSQMLSLSQARMYFNNFTGTVDASVCAKGMSIFEVDCQLGATCASICY